MRRQGLWNPRLCSLIASMGHTDTLVIADAGLPVPLGVEAIDLVWAQNQPRMLPVLEAVVADLVIEGAVVAKEATDPHLSADITTALGGTDLVRVSHEEIKARCATARAVVRTGETTPYANVILRAGVSF